MFGKPKRRQLVVIKRSQAIEWTIADMEALRAVIDSTMGKKVVAILEDAIATSLNGSIPMEEAIIEARGLTSSLDAIYRMAGRNRYTGAEQPLGKLLPGENDNTPTTMQEDDEE